MPFSTNLSSHSSVKEKTKNDSPSVNMNRVATIILGGGKGTRLHPLTLSRSKPAISFGGKYRLIDIPMSNSINSGCFKIFIITQFLSSSLHQHIYKTYRMGTFSSGFIEFLSAEEKPENKNWYSGPADAVRQNLDYFIEAPADYFLILSGDQLYNMNFQDMMRYAKLTDADLVIASTPINEQDAKRMGVLKIDKDQYITDFFEKPSKPNDLKKMRMNAKAKASLGLNSSSNKEFLGSMGIYLFKRQALLKLLEIDLREDFGKHLIPSQLHLGNTATYIHKGYWEDIGTIESFYQANIALTHEHPLFNCYDEDNPIFAHQNNLPGPKIKNGSILDSIICEGSTVESCYIQNSVLGPRTVLKQGAVVKNSYIMGNDFYQRPVPTNRLPEDIEIGENTIIENSIIDKHVHIGKNVKLINEKKLLNYNSDDIYIKDGIIVVTRGASIPDNYVL